MMALSTFEAEAPPAAKLRIRRLDPLADLALYRQAHTWLVGSSARFQAAAAVFGTLDWGEYMAAHNHPNRLAIGVFSGYRLAAVVSLTLVAKNGYEVHLEAAPDADWQVIADAGRCIRDQLFDECGARVVFAWLPRWNKAAVSLLKAIGFSTDHVTMLHGSYNGRAIEWLRYILRADHDQ